MSPEGKVIPEERFGADTPPSHRKRVVNTSETLIHAYVIYRSLVDLDSSVFHLICVEGKKRNIERTDTASPSYNDCRGYQILAKKEECSLKLQHSFGKKHIVSCKK